MTLVARIASVATEITTVERDGRSQVIDLSLQGQLAVRAEYIDDAAPDVVILTQNFTFTSSAEEPQMLQDILAFGRMVRDARIRAAGLRSHVGESFPLDEVSQ